MEKRVIFTEKAPAPIGPYSQAIQCGNMIFVSGQIAINPQTSEMENHNIEEETHRVMKNIQAILNAAGCDFSNIVKTSIFLSDMNFFPIVNKIYAGYFSDHPPARETIQVARLPKDARVEISVVAMK
ncbi:MAG: RidA family protein [Chitinophagales bacterium]|nr:RidA family protein [Chitinophagales bacterium]MDW8273321.1 RidA family protein [Chitinophagales bacterium]